MKRDFFSIFLCIFCLFLVSCNVDNKTPVKVLTGVEKLIDDINSIEPVDHLKFDVLVDDLNTIKFGKYEQDNNVENGKEDIEWIVVTVDDNSALLLSKYILDDIEYHNDMGITTWEDSYIRKWLNSDFYNDAFDEDEKKLVLEIVNNNTIPAIEEIINDTIKDPNERSKEVESFKKIMEGEGIKGSYKDAEEALDLFDTFFDDPFSTFGVPSNKNNDSKDGYEKQYLENDTNDKVFLLNISECEKYFKIHKIEYFENSDIVINKTLSTIATDFALSKGLLKFPDEYIDKWFYNNSSYWLRGPLGSSKGTFIKYQQGTAVDGVGNIAKDAIDIYNVKLGVRPAIWIDLSK